MDKDKIIDGLRMTMDLCVFDPSTGEEIDPDMLNDINRATYDACKGALEILERLDTDSDTISRQAAKDMIKNHKVDFSTEKDYRTASACVNAVPPAQPERIKGHWIDAVIPNDNGGLPVQICDQCNTFYPLAYTGGGHHYCPNCGAKMEVTT